MDPEERLKMARSAVGKLPPDYRDLLELLADTGGPDAALVVLFAALRDGVDRADSWARPFITHLFGDGWLERREVSAYWRSREP